jgi:putative ABC transport system ATP-binding protein
MSSAALVFREVSKGFDRDGREERLVLRRLSFEIPPGRIVAVVGRSGSGKSTLLHLAAGIEVPSAGRVILDGRDLGALDEHRRTLLRRSHVGLVFQFFHLLPHLSVRDNVALPEWIGGRPDAEIETRVQSLLETVGLADRARDTVQKLSGGEMQRVALCRALIRRPRLLLADEPTGNLDDDTSRRVMDLLLGMAREAGSTLIYVTHSRDLASLADEVWRLHGGALERERS